MNWSAISVIVLAGVVHATLQLSLGALVLLYHESLGKHIKIKTKRLASNYILGAMLLIGLFLTAVCYFISVLTAGNLSLKTLVIVTGILVALAISVCFFYYRSGRTTELWLPKTVSRYINRRARKTESNVEAFALGMLANFAELPFSLVLFLVAADSVLLLPAYWQILGIFLYTIIAILPLAVLRFSVKKGKTVAEIQKWRNKNKTFFKILAGCGFLTLALFLVAFKLLKDVV